MDQFQKTYGHRAHAHKLQHFRTCGLLTLEWNLIQASRFPEDFTYVHIDVEDCVHESIAMHFEKIHKIIQDAENEKVTRKCVCVDEECAVTVVIIMVCCVGWCVSALSGWHQQICYSGDQLAHEKPEGANTYWW